ncbi:MAG: hypothetical protein AAFY09_15470, partial [Pseudomonadota bacterium]
MTLVDCVLFDPFSLVQDLIAAFEVDIGGCNALQALVMPAMIAITNEPADLPFYISRAGSSFRA